MCDDWESEFRHMYNKYKDMKRKIEELSNKNKELTDELGMNEGFVKELIENIDVAIHKCETNWPELIEVDEDMPELVEISCSEEENHEEQVVTLEGEQEEPQVEGEDIKLLEDDNLVIALSDDDPSKDDQE
ncbi:hypothetical protein ACH5RR_011987 [Cinchona calisaya]|uniref:Uncharacterized protein n=1 Tax=Cinchona calisaya TaxID=153742 RepID=A0ABD3A6G8_9GENT